MMNVHGGLLLLQKQKQTTKFGGRDRGSGKGLLVMRAASEARQQDEHRGCGGEGLNTSMQQSQDCTKQVAW